MQKKMIDYSYFRKTKARVQELVVAQDFKHCPMSKSSTLSLVTADGLHTTLSVPWSCYAQTDVPDLAAMRRSMTETAMAQLTMRCLEREGFSRDLTMNMSA